MREQRGPNRVHAVCIRGDRDISIYRRSICGVHANNDKHILQND